MLVAYRRCQPVDCSTQFYNDPVSLLIPYPTLESTATGIIRPFNYKVFEHSTNLPIIASSMVLIVFLIKHIIQYNLGMDFNWNQYSGCCHHSLEDIEYGMACIWKNQNRNYHS